MKKNKKGFTLAEIIISMSIIGIIAAITIPALLVSTSEKALEAQKKALFARVSQAMSQIEDLRVYGKVDDDGNDKSSTLNFVTKSLSKVYRIKKTCDKDGLTLNCSFPSEVTTQNGSIFKIQDNDTIVKLLGLTDTSSYTGLDSEVAGFKTANGESIAIYYNPKCRGESTNGFYKGSATTAMCINMIYDLNGKDSAPNEVGKDVGFITIFFPKDPDIASPVTFANDATLAAGATGYDTAIASCKSQNKELIIPTWTDGMSMSINKKLISVSDDKYIVSGAGITEGAYEVNMSTFSSNSTDSWGSGYKLRCIYNK